MSLQHRWNLTTRDHLAVLTIVALAIAFCSSRAGYLDRIEKLSGIAEEHKLDAQRRKVEAHQHKIEWLSVRRVVAAHFETISIECDSKSGAVIGGFLAAGQIVDLYGEREDQGFHLLLEKVLVTGKPEWVSKGTLVHKIDLLVPPDRKPELIGYDNYRVALVGNLQLSPDP